MEMLSIKTEQLSGVGGGLLGNLINAYAAQVGYLMRYQWDIAALVTLAAVWDGAQVRGVGLEQ